MARAGDNDLDRRNFLGCMAWVGTGAVWTLSGGVLRGSPLGQSNRNPGQVGAEGGAALRFVQISDSHIGFDKPANTDVTATLRAAIAKINAAPQPPSFVLHTGDLTHLSKPAEFDTLQQMLAEIVGPGLLCAGRTRRAQRRRQELSASDSAKEHEGAGWHSFDQGGVHFIGLVNVVNLKAGGLGSARRRAARMAGERREAAERAARRSWCSRTFRSGRSIRSGAGAPTTARARCRI